MSETIGRVAKSIRERLQGLQFTEAQAEFLQKTLIDEIKYRTRPGMSPQSIQGERSEPTNPIPFSADLRATAFASQNPAPNTIQGDSK